MGKWLIAVGLVIAALGVAVTLGVPFGRLPGDVVVQRGSFTFYAPIVSCVILSLVFTLLISWLRR